MLAEVRERAGDLVGERLHILLERVVVEKAPRGAILAREAQAHAIELGARARERDAQRGVGCKRLIVPFSRMNRRSESARVMASCARSASARSRRRSEKVPFFP